jgi:O-glycosyl hydrolase
MWFVFLAIGLIAGVLSGCMNPSKSPAVEEITVTPTEKHQTLEGFGASGAWWAQDVGGWEDEKRDRIVDLLFNEQAGIGLSIYRYNIGGGDGENIQDPWRKTETFEVSPGVYDWSRDANAVWVMKAAHAEGVEQFVAFANSPPARMTVSGLTTGEKDGKSNLLPEMYDNYAQYLVDIVRHLKEEENIPIKWISPVNEPQWAWNYENGQEGCHYGPGEVLEVTRALIRAIQKNGLDVNVSVFESGEWKKSQVYIEKLLNDAEVAPYLDHIAIHSYWSEANDKRAVVNYTNRNFPGTCFWMTEWTEMKEGRDTSMDSALVLANMIHEDLSTANVTSWQYWIAVSRYFYHDGLIYVNLNDRSITETKRLWAMGNFSRYIRPGYVRVGAMASDEEINVTAFEAPDQSQYVVLVINNAQEPVSMDITGIPADFTNIKRYETSAQYNLEEEGIERPAGAYTYPAQSVTTLVYSQPGQ